MPDPLPIQPWFLELARCPKSGARLALASETLLARVNAAIAAGTLVDAEGETVAEPIEGGLVDESGARLYPVRGGIPSLVPGESIELSANNLSENAS